MMFIIKLFLSNFKRRFIKSSFFYHVGRLGKTNKDTAKNNERRYFVVR